MQRLTHTDMILLFKQCILHTSENTILLYKYHKVESQTLCELFLYMIAFVVLFFSSFTIIRMHAYTNIYIKLYT